MILCRPNGRLERVQVKHGRSDGRRIIVWASSHSLTKGKIKSTMRYTAELIDWLAVWDCDLDRCFYVPAGELGTGMDAVTLRFAPTLNNQSVGVRFAQRYCHI